MLAFCTSCATASSLRYLLSSRCNASGKPSRSSEKLSAAATDTGEPRCSLYFLPLSALRPQPAAYLPSESSTAHLQQGPVSQTPALTKALPSKASQTLSPNTPERSERLLYGQTLRVAHVLCVLRSLHAH